VIHIFRDVPGISYIAGLGLAGHPAVFYIHFCSPSHTVVPAA